MPAMSTCRVCQSRDLYLFLPMGDHPPANAFLARDQLTRPEARFPLAAHVCLECGVIVVPDQLPADFFHEYIYMPSASETMRRHFSALATRLREQFITAPNQRVVDIGCNDGLLLRACHDRGIATLGIEPAANIAAIARSQGLEVLNEYFTLESAQRIRDDARPAQVIVTTNTFNHIDDLHGFVRGVGALLAEGGSFIVEVPQALELVEKNEFDTVYHEHLSTFSVTSLVALYRFFGFQVVELEVLPIHGGSMRVFAERRGDRKGETAAVQEWLDRERSRGLFERRTYDQLAERVRGIRTELLSLLRRFKAEGKKLAGYGAPAKGNTLLNYYGIGPELLDFLADRNELKQGRYSPGMHIPVVGPERILETMPDYLLILAWNFADEIIQQQAAYRARGGQFIIPIPEPRIIA